MISSLPVSGLKKALDAILQRLKRVSEGSCSKDRPKSFPLTELGIVWAEVKIKLSNGTHQKHI